jgi:hypothetical protein
VEKLAIFRQFRPTEGIRPVPGSYASRNSLVWKTHKYQKNSAKLEPDYKKDKESVTNASDSRLSPTTYLFIQVDKVTVTIIPNAACALKQMKQKTRAWKSC